MASWAETTGALIADAGARRALSERLAAEPYPAFLWETAPVSAATTSAAFSDVVIDSPALARVAADPTPFAEHFHAAGDSTVATFANLGGDAVLIAPVPDPDVPGGYPHLAAFVRSAPEPARSALWLAVARAIQAHWAAGDDPLWISTSGLAVHWLHVRLDRRPKYIRHAPFRTFDR